MDCFCVPLTERVMNCLKDLPHQQGRRKMPPPMRENLANFCHLFIHLCTQL